MLGKPKQKSGQQALSPLDVTASMQGSLIFKEPVSLRISGRFQGTLETKGDLTIGEQAVVEADIVGEEITILGRVSGKVIAKRQLSLLPPGVLHGELQTPLLRIDPGAQFNGSVQMALQASGWMTSEEVAEYLEVDLQLIQQWVREGKIPAAQEAHQWRFEKAVIDEWVATQKSS